MNLNGTIGLFKNVCSQYLPFVFRFISFCLLLFSFSFFLHIFLSLALFDPLKSDVLLFSQIYQHKPLQLLTNFNNYIFYFIISCLSYVFYLFFNVFGRFFLSFAVSFFCLDFTSTIERSPSFYDYYLKFIGSTQ